MSQSFSQKRSRTRQASFAVRALTPQAALPKSRHRSGSVSSTSAGGLAGNESPTPENPSQKKILPPEASLSAAEKVEIRKAFEEETTNGQTGGGADDASLAPNIAWLFLTSAEQIINICKSLNLPFAAVVEEMEKEEAWVSFQLVNTSSVGRGSGGSGEHSPHRGKSPPKRRISSPSSTGTGEEEDHTQTRMTLNDFYTFLRRLKAQYVLHYQAFVTKSLRDREGLTSSGDTPQGQQRKRQTTFMSSSTDGRPPLGPLGGVSAPPNPGVFHTQQQQRKWSEQSLDRMSQTSEQPPGHGAISGKRVLRDFDRTVNAMDAFSACVAATTTEGETDPVFRLPGDSSIDPLLSTEADEDAVQVSLNQFGITLPSTYNDESSFSVAELKKSPTTVTAPRTRGSGGGGLEPDLSGSRSPTSMLSGSFTLPPKQLEFKKFVQKILGEDGEQAVAALALQKQGLHSLKLNLREVMGGFEPEDDGGFGPEASILTQRRRSKTMSMSAHAFSKKGRSGPTMSSSPVVPVRVRIKDDPNVPKVKHEGPVQLAQKKPEFHSRFATKRVFNPTYATFRESLDRKRELKEKEQAELEEQRKAGQQQDDAAVGTSKDRAGSALPSASPEKLNSVKARPDSRRGVFKALKLLSNAMSANSGPQSSSPTPLNNHHRLSRSVGGGPLDNGLGFGGGGGAPRSNSVSVMTDTTPGHEQSTLRGSSRGGPLPPLGRF